MTNSAVVALYEQAASGDYSFVGSGFFISDTLFATAAHVIRDGGRFVFLADEPLEFALLFCCYIEQLLPNSDDLAICSLPPGLSHPHYLALAPEITKEINHSIFGFFPAIGSSKMPMIKTAECRLAERTPRGNKFRLQELASKLPLREGKLSGMSGGPIINSAGNVVGLFTGGKLMDKPSARADYRLEGVTSMHILEIVKSLKLRLNES